MRFEKQLSPCQNVRQIRHFQGRTAMDHGSIRLLSAFFYLALVAAVGCGASSGGTPGSVATETKPAVAELPPAAPDAAAVLKQLLKTYREARSYSDSAEVVLRFRRGADHFEDRWPSSVKFERPGRLFVRAYQVIMASDGKELRGNIDVKEAADIASQFLVRPAPK